MNELIRYFEPKNEVVYFDKLKTTFFIRICLIGIVILFSFSIWDVLFKHANIEFSIISKILTIILFISSLFILKYKGIHIAGNIFSFFSIAILLFFMNFIPVEVNPLFKYFQGFYSVFAFLAFGLLFASRPVILLCSVLTLASTIHVYLNSLANNAQNSQLFTTAFVHHTVVLISITVLIYFAHKFTQLTIEKANQEIRKRELQNQELLATEEEIRASNEELVATTDALVEANTNLISSKQKAEESDRLKTEFLNNMSHEVRTPMNGIIGFSQLLDIPDLSEQSRKQYINTIQQSSNQLLSIIDNIIEISKLGTKQVKVVEHKINLNKLLSGLLDIFEIKAKDKNVRLKLHNELPDEESDILIDEIKLYKILSNLLENAMKFTEYGSVEFGYVILQPGIEQPFEERKIRFFVKDTGIGIEKEKQEFIFDKFSQIDSKLTRQFGGLGLGLSIAKENTELLGGRIALDSNLGMGSTFNLTLPYKVPIDL